MAQQGSTGKGQDANENTASTSLPKDVDPTEIEETAVEKPTTSPSSTKTSARKTTPKRKTVSPKKAAPKKKTASRKKAAPKKKAMPKKKAAPKKTSSPKRGSAEAPDLAKSKTQSTPEEPGYGPQPNDRSTSRVIHVRKRAAVWPWIILVAVVGAGTYLLNTGKLTYLFTGDKKPTASHADDALETSLPPPTVDRGEPSAPTLTREDMGHPITTTQNIEHPGQPGAAEPGSMPPFGGRFAEESVIPHSTAITPSTSETEMTRIDESYPPLQPTAPLPTESTLIEPQQTGVQEIAPKAQTTVTTNTETQTAPPKWTRDQDFRGSDVTVTDAEGQTPGVSKMRPETAPSDTAMSGVDYDTAETKKSVTGTGGLTPETADRSRAKPEVRPRANRRLPPTPPYYWHRPYRPYGPYGTYGRYPTYPPATPGPYPYGHRFANPQQKDNK